MENSTNTKSIFASYASRLQTVLESADWTGVEILASNMYDCWKNGRRIFLCGNGGSAGNAIHLANDFLYGIAKRSGGGLKVMALSSNPAVITCLANDVGYENIFSEQLAVQAESGDLLIALSGSGNSPNMVRVIEQAKSMHVKSFAILGFNGGKCKQIADIAIHFQIDDMQISEDLQMIVGHMLMQWLYERREKLL